LSSPPVDQLYRALQRAVRLVLSPDEEWRAIGSGLPDPWSIICSFVLPLACIPAAAWSFNLWLLGREGGQEGERAATGLVQILRGGLTIWAVSVLSVFVLAASICILAPLFVRARDWRRALMVAAFSAAPVFLGGAILAVPDVAYAVLLAVFHGFYLMYAGLQRVLGVKEDNAAEYVALSIVMLSIITTVLGSVGSALGLL
jgi:hypothetical protein